MRAAELEITSPVHDMLLKLRKGAAASLNAKKLEEIFNVLGGGWKIEKSKFYKLSDGGWLLTQIEPDLKNFLSYKTRNTGRINLHTAMPRELDRYAGPGSTEEEKLARQKSYRDEAVSKLSRLEAIATKLKAGENAPAKGKWFVRDVQAGVGPSVYGHDTQDYHVSFELHALCSGFTITSPDGQTYEVFGDYKNGAVGPQTFASWFAWAVENTAIMDEILEVLQMEAHEKKHDPKSRYTPPKGSSEGLQRVYEALKAMTAAVREEQKANLVTRSKRAVMNFDEAVKSGDKVRVRAIAGGYDGYIVSQCYDSRKKEIFDGWEATIEKFADRQVEEMQNMFVYKNTHKLAAIVDGKGGNETIDVLSVNGDGGIITASMVVSFPDGSNFRVVQSIVGSYSSRGTPFYRFPTTFHDVVLPGGEKMGMPSEERMNEIFAKEKGE